jgi:WD40 repeat protein
MAPGQLEYAKRELLGHRKSVHSLSWSPSGRKLASSGADDCVRTWNVEASAGAKPERTDLALVSQGGVVYAVQWHPKRDDLLASLTERYLR